MKIVELGIREERICSKAIWMARDSAVKIKAKEEIRNWRLRLRRGQKTAKLT